jgi:hypothetical protein
MLGSIEEILLAIDDDCMNLQSMAGSQWVTINYITILLFTTDEGQKYGTTLNCIRTSLILLYSICYIIIYFEN